MPGHYPAREHQDIRARLARPGDPRITAHSTPASWSWPNLAACFFPVITRQAIRRGSFTPVRQLTAATGAFTGNQDDHPGRPPGQRDAGETLASINSAKAKTKVLTNH